MNHPKQISFPQWSCRNHAELPFSESRATWPNCFRWESHVLSKTWTCHIISQNSWRIKFYWWWCQILKRYLIVICNSFICDFEIWNQTESVRLIPWSCVSYDSIVNIIISSYSMISKTRITSSAPAPRPLGLAVSRRWGSVRLLQMAVVGAAPGDDNDGKGSMSTLVSFPWRWKIPVFNRFQQEHQDFRVQPKESTCYYNNFEFLVWDI